MDQLLDERLQMDHDYPTTKANMRMKQNCFLLLNKLKCFDPNTMCSFVCYFDVIRNYGLGLKRKYFVVHLLYTQKLTKFLI